MFFLIKLVTTLYICLLAFAEAQLSVALFIQAYMIPDTANNTTPSPVWNDILTCVSNVGEAKTISSNFDTVPWENVKKSPHFSFDIYISLPRGLGFLKHNLEALGARKVHVTEVPLNVGMDIKQFLSALRKAHEKKGKAYDYFLKIHSKTESTWRTQALDSLCGSPAQVLTVMNAFGDSEKNIGVVVPQGLVIKKSTDVNTLFRPLRTYYSGSSRSSNATPISPVAVFNEKNVRNMQRVYYQMFGQHLDEDEEKYVCNAGTMFWAKYNDFKAKEWYELLPWLKDRWTHGYVQDGGIEHAIERLLITIPFLNGVDIAEIIPAPKPIGIYFPQYHPIPENDKIHSEGFTEWTLLKPSTVDFLAKPLPFADGGLGYYDLTDIDVRRRQGQLARLAGLHGFMYYHYWFAGRSSVGYKNPVMGKIPELMLQDGEPNMPFMFSWANEPWTSTWSGGDGRVFLPQNYGGKAKWIQHFEYLLPFFQHRNYIRVNDKPVFIIYRIGLMKEILKDMLHLWRRLARGAGLKGLHIVYTLNNFARKDKIFQSQIHRHCDASFQFFPTIAAAFPIKSATSTFNVDTRDQKRQYWGGFAGFSNRVRRLDNNSWTRLVPPKEFKDSLRHSFQAMGRDLPYTTNQVNSPNLFFVTAWNEWNEQAQLEPSDKYGFSYLSAIKFNLEELPMEVIE